MFECDGCGMTATTAEEIEPHILAQSTDDLSKVKCWGVMEVGGPAWLDFKLRGIHPMTAVVSAVGAAVTKAITDGMDAKEFLT